MKKRVWFVGIGGIGVSGIAKIFHGAGHAVGGSDLDRSPTTDELLRLGIEVCLGHRALNVPSQADLVVHSAAIKDGHPELEAARARGIPTRKYAQVLGELMAERRGIAVSGTHGKTTTTAMTTVALVEAGLDPTMVLGGVLPALGGSCRVGGGDLMVAEACEYDRSFLQLSPRLLVVTNIEEDHLDYYKDLEEIRGAFRALAAKVPEDGRIVVCGEDRDAVETVSGLAARVETYGIEARDLDWRATEVDLSSGCARFTVEHRGAALGRIELAVPGRHSILNALAACAVATAAGAPFERIASALARFGGVNRRFQPIANVGGVSIVDDYAHHPTEIATVLQAARGRFPGGRIIAIFQPHQYSRTRLLFHGFADALRLADEVILPEIYFSRDSEEDVAAVDAEALAQAVRMKGTEARHIASFDEIVRAAAVRARAGDLVLTMGAGDVYKIAGALASHLAAQGALAGACEAA